MSNEITVEREGFVATITLDRPPNNHVSVELMKALAVRSPAERAPQPKAQGPRRSVTARLRKGKTPRPLDEVLWRVLRVQWQLALVPGRWPTQRPLLVTTL